MIGQQFDPEKKKEKEHQKKFQFGMTPAVSWSEQCICVTFRELLNRWVAYGLLQSVWKEVT